MAVLDERGTPGTHGRVLVRAVAQRHHDADVNPLGATSERNALTVVAACGTDDASHVGPVAPEVLHVHKATTHLEGAGWRVVLVLHPHLSTERFREQWPHVLRCRGHRSADNADRLGELVAGERRHALITCCTMMS